MTDTPNRDEGSTMDLAAWQTGTRCERHDLAFCADCRDAAGIVRGADGDLHYRSDCGIESFVELTGADYEEARELVGYKRGAGTPVRSLLDAIEAVGYRVSQQFALDLDGAKAIGGTYLVVGQKGKTAHAWTIIDGQANRPFHPPFRYRMWAVAA